MKIRVVVALVGLAISFAPPAFAQRKDALDTETVQQVRGLASNYDAAFNRRDAATVAGLYTEDAVFNTPEGTFQGRQAIDELYAKHYFEEAHSKNVVTIVIRQFRLGTKYVRPEDGAILLKIRPLVLYMPMARIHGSWSMMSKHGESGRAPTIYPI